MAAFVSVSFSVPQTFLKQMQPRKLDKDSPSRQAITRTDSKFVLSCGSNKAISMNWNPHHLPVTSNPLWKIFSFSSREIVIAGYWVGPDADDGWGFVEAFIYQIT